MMGTNRRGLAWVIGSFVLCPCHLPLTLSLAAVLLAGTALGAALGRHPIATALMTSVVWALGTARGLWLLRAGS